MTAGLDPRADGSLQVSTSCWCSCRGSSRSVEFFAHLSAAFRRIVPVRRGPARPSRGERRPLAVRLADEGTLEDTDAGARRPSLAPNRNCSTSRRLRPMASPSGLKVPVRSDDRVVGMLALSSREPAGYTPADLLVAQRLANASDMGCPTAARRARARCGSRIRSVPRTSKARSSCSGPSPTSSTSAPSSRGSRRSSITCCRTTRWRWSSSIEDRHFVRQAHAPDDFPDPPFVTHAQPFPARVDHHDIARDTAARLRTRGRVRAGHRGRLPLVHEREGSGP